MFRRLPDNISYCSGFISQKITFIQRKLSSIHPLVGFCAILPLRLPCIASDMCGAAADMILEGKTGFIYPMGDVTRLSELMMFMADNKEHRQAMGRYAATHVQNFTLASTVSALENAIYSSSS